jgi:hypothetical protein
MIGNTNAPQDKKAPRSSHTELMIYNARGHKLCFPSHEKAQFITMTGIQKDTHSEIILNQLDL